MTAANDNKPTGWTSGEAKCVQCQHEWVAAVPVGVKWIECPACGLHKGAMRGAVSRPDELHWECNCGNDLFHFTPKGAYCTNCAVYQSF